MQKTGLLTLLVFLLASGICAADVIFEEDVKESAAGMNVYETALKALDYKSRMNRLYQVLEEIGVEKATENELIRTDRYVGFNANGFETIINAYGSEMMFTDLKGLKLTEKVGDLPADKEAVEIAKRFLETAGLVQIDKKELVVGHIGGLMQALATPRSNLAHEKKAVAVHFNRELDGFAVMNKGSHITVMLGDSYSPVNMYYSWREISRVNKVVSAAEAIAAEEVKALIIKDLSRVFNMDQDIIIDKIYRVYYDRGEKYIQPAYCYEGRVENKMEETQPVLGYVPGLTDPPEPVHHPAYLADLTLPVKP